MSTRSAPERSRFTRSSLSNGSRLLITDGRTSWGRRFRDLVEGMSGDLGGTQTLSEGQRQLIRRAATLSCELERLESLLAGGAEGVDLEQYGRMTDRLRRCLESLGLHQRLAAPPPPVVLDLEMPHHEA